MPQVVCGTWQYGRRTVALAAAVVAVVGLVLIGALISPAAATHEEMDRFQARYPATVGTRLDSCLVCHPAGSWGLNSYGRDYVQAARDLAAIESRDSDGDGFTNIAEIVALTFPGDPLDFPSGTPTVTPSGTVTATATATIPPPSGTPEPSATVTVSPAPSTTATATPPEPATTPGPAYLPLAAARWSRD